MFFFGSIGARLPVITQSWMQVWMKIAGLRIVPALGIVSALVHTVVMVC